MTDEELVANLRLSMEAETKKIIAKQNYDFYLSKLGNDTPEALELLEKIKNGYEPNQRDVFVIMCNDLEQIKEYTTFYDLRERIKNGIVSEQDFNYLISAMQINDPVIEEQLRKKFIEKGILVKEYPKDQETKRF